MFGFGCVGQGLYYTLRHNSGFKARINHIVVKNPDKPRSEAQELISFDPDTIWNDPEINVVIELIDDHEAAYYLVRKALSRGLSVVTANKKMLALHLDELLQLAQENGVALLYEAAACGSIPIIRTLEEYFDNEPLSRLEGIFNGTSNYILTQSSVLGLSYQEALAQAQDNGFAESDPTNDVAGWDALYKLILLVKHAFGVSLRVDQLYRQGIDTLQKEDLEVAKALGYKVKLLPKAYINNRGRLVAAVLPGFVSNDEALYHVDLEFNGVLVEGSFSGVQFFKGRGAGSLPTGAAVLSDLSALAFDYQYGLKKSQLIEKPVYDLSQKIRIYFRYRDEADLQKIGMDQGIERNISTGMRWAIGIVSLYQLIHAQEYIKRKSLLTAWAPK